jgi:23S rRNA-/tRNA-specific pseudouridylate synthase
MFDRVVVLIPFFVEDGLLHGNMSSHADVSATLTAKANKGVTESLNVETSGWYGFCFEPENADDDDVNDTRIHLHDGHVTVLDVRDGESSVVHNLPLHHEGDLITSLQYGRLMYLSKNANVSVSVGVHGVTAPFCSSDKNDNDAAIGKWRLVLQSWASLPNEPSGKLYNSQKCLICAACRKTFTTLASIETHIKAKHEQIDATSVWHTPLRILYQDNDVAMVVKPQGVSVMGDDGMTLQKSNLLMPLASTDGMLKPTPVHRLDAMTGGLLVVAKSKAMESNLKASFRNRTCHKKYRALLFGRLEHEEGVIVEPMGGRSAETRYQVLAYTRSADPMAQSGWITTVDLYPVTGRKHQLRKHMKHIGHAIWGDKRYARYPKRAPTMPEPSSTTDESNVPEQQVKADVLLATKLEDNPHVRLCLWATEITLPHPRTGKDLTVSMEEPDWLQALVKYQEQLWLQKSRECQN